MTLERIQESNVDVGAGAQPRRPLRRQKENKEPNNMHVFLLTRVLLQSSVSTDMMYAVVITALIYPVVAHWAWSKTGWASAYRHDSADLLLGCGVADVSGSGVVHLTGSSREALHVEFGRQGHPDDVIQ